MGGTSKQTQTSSSQSAPWQPAQPLLTGILNQLNGQLGSSGVNSTETNALDQLSANAAQGNPFAGQITNNATNLLNGGGATDQAGNINAAYKTYQGQMTPYADGSMVGKNPAMQGWLDTIMSDVGNSVNSQFAAAGRDLSGANQQAYGRGVAQGIAPVLASQYNQDVQNQFNAANGLYGAGNTTSGLLAGLNQQDIANRQAGTSAATDALAARDSGANQKLAIEQLRRSLPTQNLGLLAQIGIPIAGLGGQQSGTSTGTQQMSGAQQFGLIAGGLRGLWGGK